MALPLLTIPAMLAGAAINVGGNVLSSSLNNINAQGMSHADRQDNYLLNEQAAENAYNRQIDYTERYMTPEAQIKLLQEAGLSPSLMYQGGGSVQGVTAPQGAGGSGVQSHFNPIEMGNIAMQAAQTNLAQAQAHKAEAEADTLNGNNERGKAEISTLLAQKGMYIASAAVSDSEAALNKLNAYILDETKEFKIEEAQSLAFKAEQDSLHALYSAQREGLQLELDNKTFDDCVKQAAAETKIKLATYKKLLSEINVNNNQVYQIQQAVALAYKDYNLKVQRFGLEQSEFKFEQFKFDKEMQVRVEQFCKGLKAEMGETKFKTTVDLIGRIFMAILGGKMIGASMNSPIQPFQPNVNMTYNIPTGFEGMPLR